MRAKFIEITEAADYIGPGAVEVPIYQSEISALARRRGLFSQRIKQVPATGHPSRFFEERAGARSIEKSVPLKALVVSIKYNLFDVELAKQQSQFAYLQARDLADAVDDVLHTNDVALWNGADTSLNEPTTSEYFGAAGQIAAGGNTKTIQANDEIVYGFKCAVAGMVAGGARPTAIYANPVLLDLIDREVRLETGGALPTLDLNGFTVKILSTQAGWLPLIPDWTLVYTGTPGSGHASLPAYIVMEDLIQYHWLGDPNPRIFKVGSASSLAAEYIVVKFGGLAVKNATTAHKQVLVIR